jgi:hypothetical protein
VTFRFVVPLALSAVLACNDDTVPATDSTETGDGTAGDEDGDGDAGDGDGDGEGDGDPLPIALEGAVQKVR